MAQSGKADALALAVSSGAPRPRFALSRLQPGKILDRITVNRRRERPSRPAARPSPEPENSDTSNAGSTTPCGEFFARDILHRKDLGIDASRAPPRACNVLAPSIVAGARRRCIGSFPSPAVAYYLGRDDETGEKYRRSNPEARLGAISGGCKRCRRRPHRRRVHGLPARIRGKVRPAANLSFRRDPPRGRQARRLVIGAVLHDHQQIVAVLQDAHVLGRVAVHQQQIGEIAPPPGRDRRPCP